MWLGLVLGLPRRDLRAGLGASVVERHSMQAVGTPGHLNLHAARRDLQQLGAAPFRGIRCRAPHLPQAPLGVNDDGITSNPPRALDIGDDGVVVALDSEGDQLCLDQG